MSQEWIELYNICLSDEPPHAADGQYSVWLFINRARVVYRKGRPRVERASDVVFYRAPNQEGLRKKIRALMRQPDVRKLDTAFEPDGPVDVDRTADATAELIDGTATIYVRAAARQGATHA